MQSLDIISVNLWQILISLTNLTLLFLLVKKFLFGPVEKMLKSRQERIDEQYSRAEEAEKSAMEDKAEWSKRLQLADEEADKIIEKASESAKINSDRIISDAREKAESIVNQAQVRAELEMSNARETIKREIVDVSGELASKIIMREINRDDHEDLINDFIDKIGE